MEKTKWVCLNCFRIIFIVKIGCWRYFQYDCLREVESVGVGCVEEQLGDMYKMFVKGAE